MLPPATELHLATLLCIQKDKYYVSKDLAMFSMVPLEGFKTCAAMGCRRLQRIFE